MTKILSEKDQNILLGVARGAIECKVRGQDLPVLEIFAYPPPLRESRACFVTLTKRGELRGCVGSLEANSPLVKEVQVRAVMAALRDLRFPPVVQAELPEIQIEISCLTVPRCVTYRDPRELLDRIQVGEDGVILSDGEKKATFLPQVWDKIPDVETFLSKLCSKMGADKSLWRVKHLEIQTYRVEKFGELSP